MIPGKRSKLHILILSILLLLMAGFAAAENEEALILTVEADPDCFLSEAGEMTFFRFTLKNTLEETYTLEQLTLQGDLLDEPRLIAESITINANDVQEFSLEKVGIEEEDFDRDLFFQLTWQTTAYGEEDADHLYPIVTAHVITAPVHIERFIEPVMSLSCAPDVLLAREGDPITVTYTLVNDTKFDMTNITLQDAGVPQPAVPLAKNVLNAGERMEVGFTFAMGAATLELYPTAQYTVRGIESKASAAEIVAVEYVEVALDMAVEKYPATAEGTLFRITLRNDGTHSMSDIRIVDEIGTPIADGISLKSGDEKTVSYTVPSAVSSGTVRYISFEATGRDCVGGTTSVKSPSAYEVLPFVESDQVRLNLSVTLSGSSRSDDGSNRLKLLFEIHNDSLVPIRDAIISEADYFKGIVNEYASLSTGATTFEKEFVVPAGTRSLTFVMTAVDPAQTQYATVPLTLDLSPLTEPKPTAVPAIKPGKTVDTTGTIYDTERYVQLFRMTALIALALALVFLLLALIFRVAETNIRRWLPKEPVARPFGPRKTATGPIVKETVDPVHDQFGYIQPAKLRYMDRTDRTPVVGQEEAPAGPAASASSGTFTKPIPPAPFYADTFTRPASLAPASAIRRREEGDITAVPVQKPRLRPVMISTDDTLPFAPVHEDQIEDAPEQPAAEPPARPDPTPREIEMKPAPRIVPRRKLEIVRVNRP